MFKTYYIIDENAKSPRKTFVFIFFHYFYERKLKNSANVAGETETFVMNCVFYPM